MHRKLLSDNMKVVDCWEDELAGRVLRGALKMQCVRVWAVCIEGRMWSSGQKSKFSFTSIGIDGGKFRYFLRDHLREKLTSGYLTDHPLSFAQVFNGMHACMYVCMCICIYKCVCVCVWLWKIYHILKTVTAIGLSETVPSTSFHLRPVSMQSSVNIYC